MTKSRVLANLGTGFLQSGTGADLRPISSKLRDVVSAKDFGAKGNNIDDDRAAINEALSSAREVYLPAGTYLVSGYLTFPANTVLRGDGEATVIKAIGPQSHDIIQIHSVNNCQVIDLVIDGDSSGRTVTVNKGQGIAVRNNNPGSCFGHSFIGVRVKNCPNAGFLLEGRLDATNNDKVELIKIDRCVVEANNGVGVSQYKVNNSTITNTLFSNNGFENLTIDVNSNACIVDSCRFFKALGGCGNIGWDVGNACVFSNNFMDCENTTVPSAGNRNGICVNAEVDVTLDLLISNNVILNANENGIYLRNRVGQPNVIGPGGYPFIRSKAGTGAIVGNIVLNSGASDIRIEESDGTVEVYGNRFNTLFTSDPNADHIRCSGGTVAWELGLASNQSFSTGSSASQDVQFTSLLSGRRVSQSGSAVVVPVGGYYSIAAQVNLTALTASGVTDVEITVTYPGGTKSRRFNVTGNTTQGVLSFTSLIGKGDVGVTIRFFNGNGNPITLTDGSATFFTGTLVG